MPKVLISDQMDPKAAQIFRERGVEVDEITGKTKDELIAMIGQYDGLAIRSSTKVTKEVLEAATNLKVVGRAGIGVDNVDIPAASAKGVVVMNTPVRQLDHHRRTCHRADVRARPRSAEADRSTQAGKWEKNRFMGVEVTSKTLGLIGAGNIGSIVADRALGPQDEGRRLRSLPDARTRRRDGRREGHAGRAARPRDFITLHTPLTDQTRNILSRENLAKTKKGVRIINCARGGLIDEVALKEALESGQVAGAALDVFVEEPAKASPAVRHARLRLHPASGRIDQRGAGQCRDPGRRADGRFPDVGRRHQRAQHAVAVRRGSPKLRPYMTLAERLGALGRPARRAIISAASRSRSRARPPSSTRSRSPARCWRG
jgi:D-3-phosphoglycerate dehydrogenase